MFLGMALLMGIISRAGNVFMISFTMFAGTFTAYTFENTEKSNLNVLFATLPTNRKSMLVARYIFMLIVLLAFLVVAIGLGLIIDLAFSNTISFSMYLMFICLGFGLFLFNTGFQTPFFYRFGYTKGRIFLWIPIILVIIVMNLPVFFGLFNLDIDFDIFVIMFRNQTATNLISAGVGILSLVVSFFASSKVYLNKDV